MARKKSMDIIEEPEVQVVEETPVVEEPVVEPAPVVEEPVAEEAPIDIEAELKFAQEEIEYCLDYTEVPGADYKGYFRGKLKEWRAYKYALRQFALRGGNKPVRPAEVEPKY